MIKGQQGQLKAKLEDNSIFHYDLPNKTVKFYVNNVYKGSDTTDSNGIASINYTATSTTSFTLKAVFDGDTKYNSTNKSATISVNNPPKKDTRLTDYNASGTAGETVTLEAMIESKNWLGVWDSTGGLTVKFYVDGSYKGSATSTSWGQNVDFSYTIPASDAGETQTWYAKFDGNSEYNVSQSNNATLTMPSSITSAWWSITNAYDGQQVTLLAKVSGFSVGTQMQFTIYEDDGLLVDDKIVPTLSGTVFDNGNGEYYAKATWSALWQTDQFGDPEYYFEVTDPTGSIAKKSSKNRDHELKVAKSMTTSSVKQDFYYSSAGHPTYGPATDGSPLNDRTPVILVHGANGDNKPSTLNYWYWWLIQFNDPQYSSKFKIYRYVYDSSQQIASNGTDFANFVNGYTELSGKQVLIMAHSMGGLVVRHAMNTNTKFRDKTIKLVTLGTPHLGSPGANPNWVFHTVRTQPNLMPFVVDPTDFLKAFAYAGYYLAFDASSGGFDLAWHNPNDIPAIAKGPLSPEMIAAKLMYDDNLLATSLQNPFTGSLTMQLTVSDDLIIAFGGFKVGLGSIIGGSNSSTDPNIDEEVGDNHDRLAHYAVPLMKIIPKSNSTVIGNNDGLVPLESALIQGSHTAVQRINMNNEYSEDIDHSAYLDVATVMNRIMGELVKISTCIDNDGDGYGTGQYLSGCSESTILSDCDDTNPAANPGVSEICDGIDNNCDNNIDEGFNADDDGFSTCAGDCNDTNPAVNPGASEICDGIDNDCNGLVDDGLSTNADGDGHYTIGSCASPADDCDDTDPAINPGVTEGPIGDPTCSDSLDNDCDGKTDTQDETNCSLCIGINTVWLTKIYAEGQNLGGAYEYDVTIGAGELANTFPAAPSPPQYSVKMDLASPNWQMLSEDIRMVGEESHKWILAVNPHGNQGPPADADATISWDPSTFNVEGSYRLREGYDGTGQVLVSDMRTATDYTVTGGNTDQYFTIEHDLCSAPCIDMSLKANWNLISLPITPEDCKVETLFPDAIVAYGFNGSYYEATCLDPGYGYWIKVPSDKTYEICGQIYTNYSDTMTSGWHLVGAADGAVVPVTVPPDCIIVMYGFDGAYYESDTCQSGEGYWIKLKEECEVSLESQ